MARTATVLGTRKAGTDAQRAITETARREKEAMVKKRECGGTLATE